MDCKKLQNKIDELYLVKGMELDLKEQEHIDECIECRNYYADTLKAHQLLHEIQQWDPVLDNPEELTEAIMISIPNKKQTSLKDNSGFKILVRFLTAAVVTLLLTLGVEQYIVLNKIQILEVRLGKVQHDHPTKYLINKASLIDIAEIIEASEDSDKLKNISTLFQLNRFKN